MSTVKDHYDHVLSGFYSWMYGGHSTGTSASRAFFQQHGIKPSGSGIAVDLGAGSGFQSIPLARAGFAVTAIDLCDPLLAEIKNNDSTGNIRTVHDDLINVDRYVDKKAELVVCMTDTLLHLDSEEKVRLLAKKVFKGLEDKGKLILTFRDLTHELAGLDRFIPVRSDDTTIFTCFLEYESATVKVHDIIYRNENGKWRLYKSWYRKLRLSRKQVDTILQENGFRILESTIQNGLVTIISQKS